MIRRVCELFLVNQEIIVALKDLYKDFISRLGKKLGSLEWLYSLEGRHSIYIFLINPN